MHFVMNDFRVKSQKKTRRSRKKQGKSMKFHWFNCVLYPGPKFLQSFQFRAIEPTQRQIFFQSNTF